MYQIKMTRRYYGPRKTTEVVAGEDGRELSFADRKAAQAWVAQKKSERYYLGHGEYCTPQYRIVKA